MAGIIFHALAAWSSVCLGTVSAALNVGQVKHMVSKEKVELELRESDYGTVGSSEEAKLFTH